MMSRRLIRSLAIMSAYFVLPLLIAGAQTPSANLRLDLSKSYGFNLGSAIQGHFRLTAVGPADISSVTFTVDGSPMGKVQAPPYVLAFNTDDYPPGVHDLAATGLTVTGQLLESPVIRVEFITAQQSWLSLRRLLVPLLIILALTIAGGFLLPLILSGRNGKFAPGRYGAAGAAVCPHCQLPFSRHLMAPNLLGGKLERCPHCGKWSLRRRATPEEVSRAEARYLAQSRPAGSPPPDDSYRRELDDSRFDS